MKQSKYQKTDNAYVTRKETRRIYINALTTCLSQNRRNTFEAVNHNRFAYMTSITLFIKEQQFFY